MAAIVYTCLGLMLVFGVLAVMHHSMTKSAIALAIASAVLGIIMYMLGSVWAAVFEISVCSGLVTVIFVSAISLSNADKGDLEKIFETKKRMAALPVILIASGVALIAAAMATGFSLPDGTAVSQNALPFQEIFWNTRQADIWGLIVVVLTGTTAIVVLFKEQDGNDR